MKKYHKIILAYSGGLDTTVAIPWLQEETGAQVIALGVDVGQPENLWSAADNALAAKAVKSYFVDAKEEFAAEYVLPALKANALYEGEYPLVSALSRPLIAKKLVDEAEAEGADAVAHGCTGKGNDQVRFELAFAALAPKLDVIAPARHWGFTREDSVSYAKAHGIAVQHNSNKNPYSIDENLWGRAIECGALEDAWFEPPKDAFQITTDPFDANDQPRMMTIEFYQGQPIALDGVPLDLVHLISEVSRRAGACGIGRIDHVESRTVGIKSREIYECPAAIPLIRAHKALEAMVMTCDELAFKATLETAWSRLVYEGKWYSPLKKAMDAFVETTQEKVTGLVRLKMYKGSLAVVGRASPYSLYDEGLATYGAGDPFDHAASEGFVKISAMETTTLAMQELKAARKTEKVKHESPDLAVSLT